MAEYVHQTLEEMIPELEEMSRVGLFTVKETKTILKKREGHEYKLRQLTKTKESFLNYIEYETKLLELIKVRRKKYGQEALRKGIEKSIADRIHKLYRLLTMRFQECVQFWEMHIDFSKQMNEKAYVTRLYERALKLHSSNDDLWVKAAKWESSPEGNGNPHQGRTVLLKGQRTNPESEAIFLQMFLLELQLGRKIAKRKNILGMEDLPEDGTESQDPDSAWKLAEIVYRNGLSMFPDRPDIHLKLLHLCCGVKEAGFLQDKIVADLQLAYPDSPQVWNAVALRHISHISVVSKAQADVAIAKCVESYEATLENLKSEEMWSLTLRSLLNLLSLKQARHSAWLLPKVLTMFERAVQAGTISRELSVELLDLLTDLGMSEDVPDVTSRLTELHPGCAQLWLARLRLEVHQKPHHQAAGDAAGEEASVGKMVEAALGRALKAVPAEESWPLWEFCLNVCAAHRCEELESLMESACRDICPRVCLPAKEWSLHWTFRQGGIKAARTVFKRLHKMRPISLRFYQIYVTIEAAQMEPDLKRIRAVFEEALAQFGADTTDLWLNYIVMERHLAGAADSHSGTLFHRATRSLKPGLRENFIRKHALLTVDTQL